MFEPRKFTEKVGRKRRVRESGAAFMPKKSRQSHGPPIQLWCWHYVAQFSTQINQQLQYKLNTHFSNYKIPRLHYSPYFYQNEASTNKHRGHPTTSIL